MPTVLGVPSASRVPRPAPSPSPFVLPPARPSRAPLPPAPQPPEPQLVQQQQRSPERRSAPARPGSRRYRRRERENFVGNPHVVLPDDFDPGSFPGIPYDVPRFHFSYEFIRKLAARYGGAPRRLARRKAENGPSADGCACGGGGERAACTDSRGSLGRRLRRALRNVPRGFVLAQEILLKLYIEKLRGGFPTSRRTDRGPGADTCDLLRESGGTLEDVRSVPPPKNRSVKVAPEAGHHPAKTLVVQIENPFCRYVFHTMCTYYGLGSYSCDTVDGKRETHVCWLGHSSKELVHPGQSFYQWVFGSSN